MLCPSCKNSELGPVEMEKGLIAAGCERCSGVLLSLINYRYWQYTFAPQADDKNAPAGTCSTDSSGAKLCPKCMKLMTKYRIDLDTENRVELCGSCDEVWLDAGEWQILKALDLHGMLPKIFTDSWQRDIRKRREHKRWDEHFEALIGAESFARVKAFKQWLDVQDKAADIKHYLTTNTDV